MHQLSGLFVTCRALAEFGPTDTLQSSDGWINWLIGQHEFMVSPAEMVALE